MKKFFSFFLLLLLVGSIFANPVTEKKAKQVALNFYSYKAGDSKKDVKIDKVERYRHNVSVVFYIYTFKDGGFVIVSGDDAAYPILGYSVNSNLKNANLNPELSAWLEDYAIQIDEISGTKMSNVATIGRWHDILNNNFSKDDAKTVDELLETKWGQENGFNSLCPTGTPVGCVATAMAQIMKYHAYPAKGVYQHSYNHPTYGLQSANFKDATYDWSAMPNTTSSTESAKLSRHLGIAVDMDYAPEGSGAFSFNVPYVMANYFQYDQGINYAKKEKYTDANWKILLKAELDAGRPMLYSGSSTASGGHAFVCDGYDASDKFHFNWGWDGMGNGFFAIGSLTPIGQNFNSGNSVVYNIKPATAPVFNAVKKFTGCPDKYTGIRKIDAVNEYVAWSTTYDGTGDQAKRKQYIKTTDGGLTWQAKKLTSANADDIAMIDGYSADVAYIAMYASSTTNNLILKTTDGGENWTTILEKPNTSFFNVVYFFDENNGFVQGDPEGGEFELYTTTDGGGNWTRVDGANIPNPLSGEFGIVGYYTAIGNTIFFTTNKGRIYKSTDKGLNWTVKTFPNINIATGETSNISTAFSDNGQDGLAVASITKSGSSSRYKRYKTTDGGETWTEITSPTGNFYSSDISAVPGTDKKFYSVGSDTANMGVSYSIDGGDTWVELADYYKNFQITSINMASDEKGYFGSFSNTYYDGIWVKGNSAPMYAKFLADDTLGCVNKDVTFTSNSVGEITAYEWTFGEGATPANATGIGPHKVQYSSVGHKTIILKVSNSETSNTITKDNYVLVSGAEPQKADNILGNAHPSINTTEEYSVANQENTFFRWEIDQSKWKLTHNYLNKAKVKFSLFKVTGKLSVEPFNGCGVAQKTTIDLSTKPNAIDNVNFNVSVSPNPATEMIKISANNIKRIRVVATNGQVVYSENINNADIAFVNVRDFNSGIYILTVTTDKGDATEKIIIK